MKGANTAPDRVLLFLLSGLGDTLMFTPALRLMRLAWPETRLVALTMREGERDVLQTNSDLSEVRLHSFLRMDACSNLRFLMDLRRERFELSVLPCPTNRIHYNVISFLCGAIERAGFRYLRQSVRNLDFLNTLVLPHAGHVHNVEHNIVLAERLTGVLRADQVGWHGHLALTIPDEDKAQARHFLESERLRGSELIGLHVSSSRAKHMERKCWPKEKFLELIQGMTREGRRFLLFCGDEDLPESEWLMERGGASLHLARQMPIRVVAELIRACKVFVTNDSGLQHVAAAVGAPSVVIFGPTNPKRTGPWMGKSGIVRTGIKCSPCFYHTSGDLTCPMGIDFACLRDLSVAQVRASVEKML